MLTLTGHWDIEPRTDVEVTKRIRDFVRVAELPPPWRPWASYDRDGMASHGLPTITWPEDDLIAAQNNLLRHTLSEPDGQRTYATGFTSRFMSYMEDATDPDDDSWSLTLGDGISSRAHRNRLVLSPPMSPSHGRADIPTLKNLLLESIEFWNPIRMHIGDAKFAQTQVKRFRPSHMKINWTNYFRNDLLDQHSADLSNLPSDIDVTPCGNGLIVTLPGDPVAPSYEAAVRVRRALGLPVLDDPQ